MRKHFSTAFPIHPFLIAAFPVLSLLASNIVEITAAETLRSFGWFLGGAAALFVFFWGVTRSTERAGLAASFFMLLFSTFGDAYTRLSGALPAGSVWGQANVFAALWSIPMILGTWALLRLLRNPRFFSTVANAFGAGAVLSTLLPIGSYFLHARIQQPVMIRQQETVSAQPGPLPGPPPDIYYIILDGYGRSDSLMEFHQVDNRDFLRFLESRGFFIAAESSTNYIRTMHSLSSSLNFNYLDNLLEAREEAKQKANHYDAYRALIKENAVMAFFRQQGYTTVAISNGFEITEVTGADVVMRSSKLSYFEETLLSRTLAIFWVDQVVGDYRRQEIHQAFAHLEAAAAIPVPKFVFAHFLVPHPPFVFDEHGGPVAPRGWGDGNTYAGGTQHYLQHYRGQLQYVNAVMERVIVELQDRSANPPIIILQGDHGPGAYVNWIDWRETCLRERIPILNAYALPGIPAGSIPPDITPVNTFRLVLNHYFNAELAMLPNRNYAVEIAHPYRYIDVTEAKHRCEGMPGK